jgi:hypothetical protein
MALREVDLGIEAAYGVAAATFVRATVSEFTFKNDASLEQPKEVTGTSIPLHRPRPGTRQGNWTAKVYAYPDMLAYWCALLMGAPTVTAVASASGAFDHLFKPGGNAIKSATLRWKQVSSAGTIWWQATGCKAKTMKPTVDAKGLPMFEFTGFGRYAQVISAPGSPPSDTTADYVTPFAIDQQSITLNSSDWDLLTKLGFSIDNGIAPDWTIGGGRDFTRIKIGDVAVDLDATAFLDAYAGSMEETQDGATALMDAIELVMLDDVTEIGTGTPTNPSITIAVPAPYVDGDSPDFTNTDTMETAKLLAAYDDTLASNISITLRNELASSVYTGS